MHSGRRGIAVGTAVVLALEAVAIAAVNWVLGLVVQHQQMSLAGLSHDSMAVGSWVGGGLFGLFLLVCAVLAVRIAIRDEMTGRVARIVLIVCAVVHGVLGALVVGLVGWPAFAVMMVVLGLLVGTLLLYAPDREPGEPGEPGEPDEPDEPVGTSGDRPSPPEAPASPSAPSLS